MKTTMNAGRRNVISAQLYRRILFAALGLAVLIIAAFAGILPNYGTQAAGTINGRVFIDYNQNGAYDVTGAIPNMAVDLGVSAVTVTAYDPAGTPRGSTTSGATGTYTLAATGTGPYRIEFTNLPAGYAPTTVGANNASEVRFVLDGNSANVDFGITNGKDYCQNNPEVATTCFSGTVAGLTADPVLVSFPYQAGTTSTTSSAGVDSPTGHNLMVPQNQLGSIWGLAYHKRSQKIFAGAFTKRHAGFRNNLKNTANSDPTGEIFISNTTGGTGSLFVNLNTLFGSNIFGANPHDITNYQNDFTAFDAVGKTGMGDIDISEDEQTLYVTNLANRNLYAVPLGAATPVAPTVSSAVKVYNLAALMNPGTGATGCPMDVATPGGEMNRNLRTGAIQVRNGKIFVGLTCTAQSTGTSANLRAFVYELDPAGTGSAVQVTNIPLNYPRGCVSNNGTVCAPAAWLPWTNNVNALLDYTPWGQKYYPQPWLIDIDFDQKDFMTMGFSDRLGHQTGNDNAGANTGTVEGVSAGDTLRLSKSGSTWTLEANASDTVNSTAGAGTNQGPGGGEFYHQDGYAIASNVHSEITLGGLLNVPGYQEVMISAMDPAPTNTLPGGQNTYRAGGMIYASHITGARTRSYQLFNIDTPNTFGKAAGIGDLAAMCDNAPLQVGNRVWNDVDKDGIQDAGETNLVNVAMELWSDTTGNGQVDTRIGTVNTDANGNYVFGGPNSLNMANYTCGTTPGSISAQVSTSTDDAEQNLGNNNVSINGNDLELTSDGNTLQAVGVRFNNLAIPNGATITGAYLEFFPRAGSTLNSGSPAITIQAENVNSAATFANSNSNISGRTLTTQSAPWSPPNWSSGVASQTSDLSTVVQAVVSRTGWASGNSMAFVLSGSASNAYRRAESFDGSNANAPRLVVNFTVPASCPRKVLPNTAHEVRIPSSNFNTGNPLVNFYPAPPNADVTANGDARDSDGIVTSGSDIRAPFVTSDYGKNDHSFDFGFIASAPVMYSVGNRVWYDTNNNGIIEPTERGIPGVSVSVFLDADGNGVPDTPASPIRTITTDTSGYYRFDSLAANRYVIRINPVNFNSGGLLVGYQNTAGNNTGDVESYGASSNAENGINPSTSTAVLANGLLSNSINLTGSAKPLSEADVPGTGLYAGQGTFDNYADMTVDFGFFGLNLRGTLWNDRGPGAQNDNGQLDAGEILIPGFNVRLYNSSNVEILVGPDGILGTADDAAGGVTSNSTGDYRFECLPQGNYRVVVNPQGGPSSTPTEANPNLNGDSNDNGFPDNTGNFASRVISGIVNLTPGYVGAQGNNSVNNNVALSTDPTVDFGFLFAPTQVKLDKFDAFYKGSNVVLEWNTGGESDNLGFNVYRSNGGGSELVNAVPVAGSSLTATENLRLTGNEYRWIDSNAKPGSVYYLEDIDLDGTKTMHGPIYPQVKFSLDISDTSSKTLADYTSISTPRQEKEIVVEKFDKNTESSSSNSSKDQKRIAALRGVKIMVSADDRYVVPFSELHAFGFNTNSPSDNWQLYANSKEVPMKVGAGSVEFFGLGYESAFVGKQTYYLVRGTEPGLRLEETINPGFKGNTDAQNFRVTAVRKDRGIYATSILNGETENWFGGLILTSSDNNQVIEARNPDQQDSRDARLRVKIQGLTDIQHYVNVSFNGTQIGTVDLFGKENANFEFDVPMSSVNEGANTVKLRSVGTGSDVSLVDEVSIRYSRQYVASGGKLRFTVPAGQTARIGGFNNGSLQVFELDAAGNPLRKVSVKSEESGGSYRFSLNSASYDRQFAAYDGTYSSSVGYGLKVDYPSNLSTSRNGARVLVLAPGSFGKQAEGLVNLHSDQKLKSMTVDIDDVYDEFNFGRKSDRAIKDFLELAHTTWGFKPEFVVLLGDSSYDMRNYLGQADRDIIPTRLFDTRTIETSSDAWLADFDNDGIEDIAIGRLPAGNGDEASMMVDKQERYGTQASRKIKTSLFVADNGFQSYSDSLEALLPANVLSVKLDRAAMSDSVLHDQIIDGINGEAMAVTYTGHGSPSVWAGDNVFRVSDANNLTNRKLSFFMMMTCLNGYNNNTSIDSLSERLFKAQFGAAALWSSSGSTYATDQIGMSKSVIGRLFDGNIRIGDLTREAKLTTTDLDTRLTWHLVGDPTAVIK